MAEGTAQARFQLLLSYYQSLQERERALLAQGPEQFAAQLAVLHQQMDDCAAPFRELTQQLAQAPPPPQQQAPQAPQQQQQAPQPQVPQAPQESQDALREDQALISRTNKMAKDLSGFLTKPNQRRAAHAEQGF